MAVATVVNLIEQIPLLLLRPLCALQEQGGVCGFTKLSDVKERSAKLEVTEGAFVRKYS